MKLRFSLRTLVLATLATSTALFGLMFVFDFFSAPSTGYPVMDGKTIEEVTREFGSSSGERTRKLEECRGHTYGYLWNSIPNAATKKDMLIREVWWRDVRSSICIWFAMENGRWIAIAGMKMNHFSGGVN
jgi:hypothetical protein